MGINCFDQSKEKNHMWKGEVISKEEVEELYFKQGYSLLQIGRMKNTTEHTIKKRILSYGYKTRTWKEQKEMTKKFDRDKREPRYGKDNPAYKHGKLVGQKQNRSKYVKIAKSSFKEWRCAMCEKENTNENFDLVIHHLDHNNKNNNLTNLMVLCQSCHWKIHHPSKEYVCQYCNEKFTAKGPKPKYCSKMCWRIGYAKNKLDKNKQD